VIIYGHQACDRWTDGGTDVFLDIKQDGNTPTGNP